MNLPIMNCICIDISKNYQDGEIGTILFIWNIIGSLGIYICYEMTMCEMYVTVA